MTTHSTPNCAAAVLRRFYFAAWPQSHAHVSWFRWLDERTGLPVSRDFGIGIGDAEQAVAQALLCEARAGHLGRVSVGQVPIWAMDAHRPMQVRLSTVAALSLLPELLQAVSGDVARRWDTILGTGVRRAAMSLRSAERLGSPAAQAVALRPLALQAAKAVVDWDLFCLRLGLTALTSHGRSVHARVRLVWPHSFGAAEPLPVEAAVRDWLAASIAAAAPSAPEQVI